MREARPIPTGNAVLDTLLDGGIPPGSLILVEGEEGAGGTEFALSLLRGIAKAQTGIPVRFATALRAPERVEREAALLFKNEKEASLIEYRVIRPEYPGAGFRGVLEGLSRGGILVLETASALHRWMPGGGLVGALQALGDAACAEGVTILLLHHRGTLPGELEACLAEACDGLLSFGWREATTSRRRVLRIQKLRGLPGILDGDQAPILEVALRRGTGFTLSSVKSVV